VHRRDRCAFLPFCPTCFRAILGIAKLPSRLKPRRVSKFGGRRLTDVGESDFGFRRKEIIKLREISWYTTLSLTRGWRSHTAYSIKQRVMERATHSAQRGGGRRKMDVVNPHAAADEYSPEAISSKADAAYITCAKEILLRTKSPFSRATTR